MALGFFAEEVLGVGGVKEKNQDGGLGWRTSLVSRRVFNVLHYFDKVVV